MAKKEYLEKYPRNPAKVLWVVKPIAKVLRIFGKTVLHRPVTILYPYEVMWMPENYRGRPGLRFDRCVGCGICVRICPTACLKLVDTDNSAGEKVKRPQLNLGRCAMCGYCAEYCPVQAMTVTPEFELAEFTREDMIYGPKRLAYESATEKMEVRIEQTLMSDIANGNPERRVSPFMTDRPVLEEKKCISCKKCEKVCPVNAVKMVEHGVNEKGRPILYPEFDNDACICCENCVEDCPKDALYINEVL
jgi:NADH-quinone oxidoreductase subunit I/NAD(P)H-quinone oxidoreductase subunit I